MSIPGVGTRVPVEILASDVVSIPGMHGRPLHAFGFLPWECWWGEDPLVTQQAVPRVDEVFFDYPCIELPETEKGATRPASSVQRRHHAMFCQESDPALTALLDDLLFTRVKDEGGSTSAECIDLLFKHRAGRRGQRPQVGEVPLLTKIRGLIPMPLNQIDRQRG